EQIGEQLRISSHDTALAAVSDAIRLVLQHYISEGDLARRRYAITTRVPALRDREIASVARYQRLFRELIADWMGDTAEPAPPGPRRGGRSPCRPRWPRLTTTCCAAGCAARVPPPSAKSTTRCVW